MKHKLKKGFTLIELLVVVAIIGVLATIVLSSLGEARNRAKDAKIIAGLNQLRTLVELDYNGSYNDVCLPATSTGQYFTELVKSARIDSTRSRCYGTASELITSTTTTDIAYSGVNAGSSDSNSLWGISIALPSGGFQCVDSLGSNIFSLTNPLTSAVDKRC